MNQNAMKSLNKGRKQEAINLLREAESILFDEHNRDRYNVSINRLIGITLNNLGCYFQKYHKFLFEEGIPASFSLNSIHFLIRFLDFITLKRDEKPQVALKYLQKALEIETITQNDFSTLSGTHLNICAILSSLDKHQEAIKHANAALHLVQKAKGEILGDSDNLEYHQQQVENEQTRLLQHLKTQVLDLAISLQKSSYNIYTTEIVSYYNLGIEYQHLNEYSKSLHMLRAGYSIALKNFGDKNPLSIKMDDAIKKAEKTIKSKIEKTSRRFMIRQNSIRFEESSNQTYLGSSDYSNSSIYNPSQQRGSSASNNVSNGEFNHQNKEKRQSFLAKELSLTVREKEEAITESSTTRKKKRRVSSCVSQQHPGSVKSIMQRDMKLPNLNNQTIEHVQDERVISKTPNASSSKSHNLKSLTPMNNLRSKSQIDFQIQDSQISQRGKKKERKDEQHRISQNKSDILNHHKNETALQQDDQIQETIFAQIVRKKQQMTGTAVNESQKQWCLMSAEKGEHEKHQQLLTQIFNNMEGRNNTMCFQMNETSNEWDSQKNHKKLKSNFGSRLQPLNPTPLNRQQRSLSQNPRNRYSRVKQDSEGLLNPISNNNNNNQSLMNQTKINSKFPTPNSATQTFVQNEINTLKLKENILHIKSKINNGYQAHNQVDSSETNEKTKTLSPKQIQRTKGRVGVRRIKFQTITPSPVSRRLKNDIKNECIQEEDDHIQESISIKKKL